MYEWFWGIFANKTKFHDAGGPGTVVSPKLNGYGKSVQVCCWCCCGVCCCAELCGVVWCCLEIIDRVRMCPTCPQPSPARCLLIPRILSTTSFSSSILNECFHHRPQDNEGIWRMEDLTCLNSILLELIHRFNVLICKILSLCYTQCKVNCSTTQNKLSEPLLIFVWFLSMCSVLFLLGSVLVLLGCLKLPTSFKQDSWYLIPCHNIKWMLCIVKIRIVCNIHFWIFPYIPVLLCNVLH